MKGGQLGGALHQLARDEGAPGGPQPGGGDAVTLDHGDQ